MRYIIGTSVIIAAFVALVATSMRSNTLRAVPVGDLRAADATPHSFVGQRLRVVGFVAADPVQTKFVSSPAGEVAVHAFAVVDRGKRLAVEYRDALPDTFRAGGPVQVDGIYRAAGLMSADRVLTKCPSKYQSETVYQRDQARAHKSAATSVKS